MKLNKIFSSHMVFAANKPIRIYGEGDGTVQIEFAGVIKSTFSNASKWSVQFPSMQYGGPYELTVRFEDETVVLDDIFIGEVFLFAGQSNMQFKMSETDARLDDFESNTMLRLFSTDRIEDSDYFKASDGWVPCKKEQIGFWTAVGYYTAAEIFKKKNIAIGVIACYQGASVIESWVPKGSFERVGIELADEQKLGDHFFEEWSSWNRDGALYEHCLSQVIPFSLSGAVWYQGESDTSVDEGRVYADELKELIRLWREDFKNPSLPFVIVQIADFEPRKDEGWALVQAAQLKIQELVENVSSVISRDVCQTDDIHPQTKSVLSQRVAQAMLKYI